MVEDMGCTVDCIDYMDTMGPDLRVERLLEVLAEDRLSLPFYGGSVAGTKPTLVN